MAGVLSAAHFGYGAYRMSQPVPPASDATALSVRLVQPVIDQARKMDDADRANVFEEHLALSACHRNRCKATRCHNLAGNLVPFI